MEESGLGLHGNFGDSLSDESPGSGFTSVESGQDDAGFDYIFVHPVDDKFECPICCLVLRNPVQTECGHRFCGFCIRKWICEQHSPSQAVKCPICSDLITEHQLFSDNFVKREILGLKVRCPHYEDGCKQITELRHIQDHWKRCDYTMIQCTHGCLEWVLRKDLQRHLEVECQQRHVPCHFCDAQVAFKSLQIHIDNQCPLVMVPCNHCGRRYPRQGLDEHIKRDCDKMVIDCTFKDFGCSTKVERSQLDPHLQLYTQTHMKLLADTLNTVTQSLPSRGVRASDREEMQRVLRDLQLLSPRGGDDIHRVIYSTTDSGLASTPTSDSSSLPRPLPAQQGSPLSLARSGKDTLSYRSNEFNMNIPTGYSDPLPLARSSTAETSTGTILRWKPLRASMGSIDTCLHTSVDQRHDHKIEELAEKSEQQERKLIEQEHQLSDLRAQNFTLEQRVMRQDVKINKLEEKLVDFQQRNCQGTYVWRITDYSRKKLEAQQGRNTVIHSPGFYTGMFGYKLCIRFNINGVEMATGTQVSLFVHFMQGEYDDILDWPFSGKITLAIIDQTESSQQRQHISETLVAKPSLAAFQKPKSYRNHKGFGYVEFAPISLVEGTSPIYVKNDTAYIKVKVVEESNQM